jgi:hypothetical protein
MCRWRQAVTRSGSAGRTYCARFRFHKAACFTARGVVPECEEFGYPAKVS